MYIWVIGLAISIVSRQCHDSTSQILTVLSLEPDASRWPSGENATERTQLQWPLRKGLGDITLHWHSYTSFLYFPAN